MPTRALYSVYDDNQEPLNIYIHFDGYPTGAADHIRNAFEFAWLLPRFEADEFAAAICAGVKTNYLRQIVEALELQIAGKPPKRSFRTVEKLREYAKHYNGGGVRVFPAGNPQTIAGSNCCDIEFRYELRSLDGKLWVKAFSTSYWDYPKFDEKELFSGEFKKFDAWAKREEKKARAA